MESGRGRERGRERREDIGREGDGEAEKLRHDSTLLDYSEIEIDPVTSYPKFEHRHTITGLTLMDGDLDPKIRSIN